MRPGEPSIGVFNASFALIVRTVCKSVRYRKPWPRTWCLRHGTWCLGHGTWCLAWDMVSGMGHGVWHGTWCLGLGHGVSGLGHGVSGMGHGVWHGTWCLAWGMVSQAWDMVSPAWDMVSQAWDMV